MATRYVSVSETTGTFFKYVCYSEIYGVYEIMSNEHSPGSEKTAVGPPTDRVHRFRYDDTDTQSLCVSVIRAVAEVAAVDPLALQPRLYDVIDPDALEKLVGTPIRDGTVAVTFRLSQYEVTVTQCGTITVRDETADTALDPPS